MASRIAKIEIRPAESAIWSVEARAELFRRFFIYLGALGLRDAREREASFMIEATSPQCRAFSRLRIVGKNFRTNSDRETA